MLLPQCKLHLLLQSWFSPLVSTSLDKEKARDPGFEVPAPCSTPGVPAFQVFVPGTCTHSWVSTRFFFFFFPACIWIPVRPAYSPVSCPTETTASSSLERKKKKHLPGSSSNASSPPVVSPLVEAVKQQCDSETLACSSKKKKKVWKLYFCRFFVGFFFSRLSLELDIFLRYPSCLNGRR